MRGARWLLFAVPYFIASCCCDDDDDCWHDTECYWSGCCYTCYEVEHCHPYYGVAMTDPESLDLDVAVAEAGDGKVDVLVRAFGRRVDGTTSISVRLIGPGIADLRRESPKSVWGFHGIPASSIERVEAVVAGADIRAERLLALDAPRASLPCDPRDLLLGMTIIPPSGEGLPAGTELTLTAPAAAEILAAGGMVGLEVECFRPGDGAPFAVLLREGETVPVLLDRPGRWTFRSTVLADDLCGEPAAEALVVEEREIEVR